MSFTTPLAQALLGRWAQGSALSPQARDRECSHVGSRHAGVRGVPRSLWRAQGPARYATLYTPERYRAGVPLLLCPAPWRCTVPGTLAIPGTLAVVGGMGTRAVVRHPGGSRRYGHPVCTVPWRCWTGRGWYVRHPGSVGRAVSGVYGTLAVLLILW